MKTIHVMTGLILGDKTVSDTAVGEGGQYIEGAKYNINDTATIGGGGGR